MLVWYLVPNKPSLNHGIIIIVAVNIGQDHSEWQPTAHLSAGIPEQAR